MKYGILVLLLVFAAACTTAAPAAPAQNTVVAQESTPTLSAPAVEVSTLEGETFSLASNVENGKPTVVYFMASTCTTCAKNWAALNAVLPDYEGLVEFVAVSVDPTDSVSILSDLAAEKNFAFKTSAGNPELAREYEVKKQTAKFAIDAEGNIVERHDGALTEAEWRAFFNQLLPADKVPTPSEKTVVVAEETPKLGAPALDVTTSEGDAFSLADNVAEGKPTVVYFMASWCGTCAKNWNALNEVYPKYEDQVEFIAVSVDPTDDAKTLQDLAAEKGFLFQTSPGNAALAIDYDVKKQTAKFAIDSEGNIVERHDGALTAEEWDAFFAQLI